MSRMEITGFKRFKGVLEGKEINTAKVFVRVKIDASRNNIDQFAGGFCTEELRLDPAILKRIEHNTFPLICDVDTERVSNGKEAREVVTDIRPVEAAPAKPLKAA